MKLYTTITDPLNYQYVYTEEDYPTRRTKIMEEAHLKMFYYTKAAKRVSAQYRLKKDDIITVLSTVNGG